MVILVDTNIFVDYISERQPFFDDSSKIIRLCVEGAIDGCISAHTITNLFYILRKELSVRQRKVLLLDFCQAFAVVGVDLEKLENSLQNDGFDDLEDCKKNMECIA